MSEQVQQQLQIRMKMLDDVFHNAIIALEKLEVFLESERGNSKELLTTAIKTERDLHDDEKNPPTRERLYGEMQLQCTALYYQTKFDDPEIFKKAVKNFLVNLFQWYAGRKNVEPNDVEKFFIPFIGSLSRQITLATQVSELVKKYVIDIVKDISTFTDEEKEKAITEGYLSYIRAVDRVGKSNEEFVKLGKDVTITLHKRGEAEEGYIHLQKAFSALYEDETPLAFLEKVVANYLPELLKKNEDESKDKTPQDTHEDISDLPVENRTDENIDDEKKINN